MFEKVEIESAKVRFWWLVSGGNDVKQSKEGKLAINSGEKSSLEGMTENLCFIKFWTFHP